MIGKEGLITDRQWLDYSFYCTNGTDSGRWSVTIHRYSSGLLLFQNVGIHETVAFLINILNKVSVYLSIYF